MSDFINPELTWNGDDLFDFDAASIDPFYGDGYIIPLQHMEDGQDEDLNNIEVYDQSESALVPTAGALDTRNHLQPACYVVPRELHNDFSGVEEPSTPRSFQNFDSSSIQLANYLDNSCFPDSPSAPIIASGDFSTFAHSPSKKSAGVSGEPPNHATESANQSEYVFFLGLS